MLFARVTPNSFINFKTQLCLNIKVGIILTENYFEIGADTYRQKLGTEIGQNLLLHMQVLFIAGLEKIFLDRHQPGLIELVLLVTIDWLVVW